MSRGKQGTKAGKIEKNRIFQAALRARKRLRRQRREDQVENHGPIFTSYSGYARKSVDGNDFVSASNDPNHTVIFPTPTTSNREVHDMLIERGVDEHTARTILLDSDLMPTEAEWNEVVAEAKRKKKGVKIFAARAGWKLVGDDPKKRESWTAR